MDLPCAKLLAAVLLAIFFCAASAIDSNEQSNPVSERALRDQFATYRDHECRRPNGREGRDGRHFILFDNVQNRRECERECLELEDFNGGTCYGFEYEKWFGGKTCRVWFGSDIGPFELVPKLDTDCYIHIFDDGVDLGGNRRECDVIKICTDVCKYLGLRGCNKMCIQWSSSGLFD
eukprot:6745_1